MDSPKYMIGNGISVYSVALGRTGCNIMDSHEYIKSKMRLYTIMDGPKYMTDRWMGNGISATSCRFKLGCTV